jgi:hypothetical protein
MRDQSPIRGILRPRNRQVGGSNPPRAPPTPPSTCGVGDSVPAAIVSSSHGVSVVRPSVQDASPAVPVRLSSRETEGHCKRHLEAALRRQPDNPFDHQRLRVEPPGHRAGWVEKPLRDSGHAAGSNLGQAIQMARGGIEGAPSTEGRSAVGALGPRVVRGGTAGRSGGRLAVHAVGRS